MPGEPEPVPEPGPGREAAADPGPGAGGDGGAGDGGAGDGAAAAGPLITGEIASRYAGAMLLHAFGDRARAGESPASASEALCRFRYTMTLSIFYVKT